MAITETIKPERIVKKINFLDEMSGSESNHFEINHFEHSSQPENGCHSTVDSDTNKSCSSVNISSIKKRPISKEEKLGWLNALVSVHNKIVEQGNSTEMSS
ncbi:14728_t:CDS:2, partial [Gigaspora rosea]